MIIAIPVELLRDIHSHGEQAYPEEGAGLLLGQVEGDRRLVASILRLENSRENEARRSRYLLTPQDYLWGEEQAEQLGLQVVGVFHSHPDAPSRPSEFDREWAWPSFTYIITSIQGGQAIESQAWFLSSDRSGFLEERIESVEPV